MLLEQGALCERDTFQGERCLYNALNDRIRNLLLSYDYSKSTDPLQPLAAHITSLLSREVPKTSDITLHTADASFTLHKFVLSARSPYFGKKFAEKPEITSYKLSQTVPTQAFETCIRFLYMGEVSADLGEGEEERAVLTGIDKLSRQLEVERLFEGLLVAGDRRQARQRRTEEVERARGQIEGWFKGNVLRNKVEIETEKVKDVRWDRENAIFADVLLQAEDSYEEETPNAGSNTRQTDGPLNGIPIGPSQTQRPAPSTKRSVLFPCHRAMLLRSELFATMFASPFREGQETTYLQVVPVDCSPEVLEVILTFLYTEKANFPLSLALDVLHAADMLFIERLKQRAALLISTLGNGSASVVESENPRGETSLEEEIDIYDVVRAGWDTRVHRLEEFGARYIAYRLERFIDELDFSDLVRESASRIRGRQETDTVELVDDIRYYLSERFRLRFEDTGFDEMMDETAAAALEESEQDAATKQQQQQQQEDEGVDIRSGTTPPHETDAEAGDKETFAPDIEQIETGVVRTFDGEIAGDEFAQDAMNYQILLGKIDTLLENLKLDA